VNPLSTKETDLNEDVLDDDGHIYDDIEDLSHAYNTLCRDTEKAVSTVAEVDGRYAPTYSYTYVGNNTSSGLGMPPRHVVCDFKKPTPPVSTVYKAPGPRPPALLGSTTATTDIPSAGIHSGYDTPKSQCVKDSESAQGEKPTESAVARLDIAATGDHSHVSDPIMNNTARDSQFSGLIPQGSAEQHQSIKEEAKASGDYYPLLKLHMQKDNRDYQECHSFQVTDNGWHTCGSHDVNTGTQTYDNVK